MSQMERLWAPWRMQYILNGNKNTSDSCVFCTLPADSNDEENLILYRGKLCFIILNLFPYNNGHLMVAPYSHVSSLTELSTDELSGMMLAIKTAISALEGAIHPEGFNVGMNLGSAAGAGIPGHVHFHIVPRWDGDTNFMPVLGNTKIINQILSDSYKKIKEALYKTAPFIF